MFRKYLICLLVFALSACANITPQVRRQNADALAAAHQWKKLLLPTNGFTLAAYAPVAASVGDTLTVYLEGDGFAWVSSSQASGDPTPRDPIGLKLALRHASGAAVYLGRPCQYIEERDAQGCMPAYWTNLRFAEEVIDATNQAIDVLKLRFGARQLVLVGYSGGGAVAALVAARRTDIIRLVTVAGNLDHAAWTTMHRIRPLSGSLNPGDAWRDLQRIPQVHFVGAKDDNISVAVAHAYAARFPAGPRPRVQVVPETDHSCCWVDRWPSLLDTQAVSHD